MEVVYTEKPGASFVYGWIFGVIFMGGISYWLTVLPGGYIGWTVYCAFYSLYPAGFCAVMSWLKDKLSHRYIITGTVPFIWVSMEWIRSCGFMGFTWINLGHSQYNFLELIQISSITGVMGVSFLIVAVNNVFREILSFNFPDRFKSGTLKNKKEIIIYTLIVIVIFISTISYGFFELNTSHIEGNSETKIAIIQPSIDQSIKWDKRHQGDIIKKYFSMTREASLHHPDIVLWPETAIPSFLLLDNELMYSIRTLLKEVNTFLLTGTVDLVPESRLIFNTALMLSPEGNLVEKYHKMHLVPFGEYLPGRKYLERMSALKEVIKPISRFSSGQEVVIFKTPYIKFSTVICFESIFPDISRKCMLKGAECIIVLTNDAWFERSAAPFQHNIKSVFRAVENRTFVVRCANTGVSSIIEPTGKIIDSTPIYEEKILYATIYPHAGTTFYTYYGDVFALFCFIICNGLLLYTLLIEGRACVKHLKKSKGKYNFYRNKIL